MKRSAFVFVFAFLVSLLPFLCNAQDHPVPGTTVLPFQQDASGNNDEQIAMQFFQNQEFAKAAEVYERIYDAKPSPYIYTYYLASLTEIGEYSRAERLVKSEQKRYPEALKYLVDLGYISFRKGDTDKARKIYEDALKKLGPNQQQVFELANAFITRNENDYAIRVYEKGRQLLNNSYPFSFELAFIYQRTGEFKKVLQEYFNLLESNRSYLNTVQDRLQYDLAYDPDNSKNELFRKYLLEMVQKDPEKTYYSEMLWWYSVQQKDFDLALIQARSLDRRMKEDGGRVFQLSRMAISNGQFTPAIEGFTYLVTKGKEYPFYYESRTELLNTRFLQMVSRPVPSLKDLSGLQKEFHTELASASNHTQLVALTKNLAHLDAFYLGKEDEAIELLSKVTDRPDIDLKLRSEAKLEMADIYLFTGDAWDATLLYQQVYLDFKNEEIGETAKFRNAKLSYYIGEFKWAQSQLDILKASTSKLIANDAMELSLLIRESFDPDSTTLALGYYSRADLLGYRNKNEEALKTLDSIPQAFTEHPIFPRMNMAKAKILMKTSRFAEADTLLGTVVARWPQDVVADQALFLRAQMNEDEMKNTAGAMAFYEELLSRYPGSIYVPDARKRFRQLRGDKGF